MNPLLLVLQAGPARSGRPDESACPLSILLDADRDQVREDRFSPLIYAVGLQNKAAVEDLSIARANVNYCATVKTPLTKRDER